jgi:hypothetical protein
MSIETYGLSYPLALTPNGSLAQTMASEADSRLIQAIKSAVYTHRGERLMRPLYGAPNVTFDTIDLPRILADYEAAIKEAVKHLGRKVGIRTYGAINDEGILLQVEYITPQDQDFLNFAIANAFV